MYPLALFLHSWLRWVVVILGVVAVVRALGGRTGRPWSSADDNVGKWFSITLDIQFLIGLLLYVWLSPITQAAFADFGGAMRNRGLRFWAVEHVTGMVIAIALVHIGRAKIRKATTDSRRHSLAAIFYGIAIIVMLASIPWPGMAAGRPLFRGI
jgi:glucose uptake protein GlcU